MQNEKKEDRVIIQPSSKWVTDKQELADAKAREEREDRNIETNSNGVFLVDHKCGSCGGKMMVGSLDGKVRVWCPRCKLQMTKEVLKKYGFNTFGSGL